MMKHFICLLSLCYVLQHLHISRAAAPLTADADLARFLDEVNERLADLYNKEIQAGWQNELEGPYNLVALVQSETANGEIMDYIKKISAKVEKFKRLPIENEELKRQLSLIPLVGYEALLPDDLNTMYDVTSNMSNIYINAKLCSYTNRAQCNLSLVPDVQNIVHASRDIDEIEYYWKEWREKKGLAAKGDFIKFVELYRKAAILNGFKKPSDYWYRDLQQSSAQVMRQLEDFMLALQPIFREFHAYVRGSLRKMYGRELIKPGQPYPQSVAEILIGNAFRRVDPKWIVELPYPEVGLPNITEGLLRRGLSNPQRMFWNVAEYFRTLGFPQLEHDFWLNNAKPKANGDNAHFTCWHKAWSYYGVKRVNLTYCPNVDEESFANMFEVMSDIYYYKAYESLPILFEEDPFPNFSDGLGKAFALAASSPKYLEKLKIIEQGFATKEARVNRLYVLGLRTIFLLPVFYLLDRYRVGVLDNEVDISNNCAFWQLTEMYTGAAPPVLRSNADFDAPAKFLMDVDEEYTSQILSTVLEFQVYKHFCEKTNRYNPDDPDMPLDLCDLSDERDIGSTVMKAMSLGISKPYPEVLQVLLGTNRLDINGLLDYFKPLHDWLIEQNQKENNEIGWEKSNKCIP